MDNKQHFQAVVCPGFLITQVMRLAHDELGRNCTTRTYILVTLYY